MELELVVRLSLVIEGSLLMADLSFVSFPTLAIFQSVWWGSEWETKQRKLATVCEERGSEGSYIIRRREREDTRAWPTVSYQLRMSYFKCKTSCALFGNWWGLAKHFAIGVSLSFSFFFFIWMYFYVDTLYQLFIFLCFLLLFKYL